MDKPLALRWADFLDRMWAAEPAAELRRLHDAEKAYDSACDMIYRQDKKLKELETVNAELLAALNNIEVSTYDAMTAALARAAIARAEEQK